jgi:hypothetical protein
MAFCFFFGRSLGGGGGGIDNRQNHKKNTKKTPKKHSKPITSPTLTQHKQQSAHRSYGARTFLKNRECWRVAALLCVVLKKTQCGMKFNPRGAACLVVVVG